MDILVENLFLCVILSILQQMRKNEA